MSDSIQNRREEPAESPLEPGLLDGHTVEELSDYLDRNRTPRDESIESSPGAQNALAALTRLRAVAPRILEAEADVRDTSDESWIKRILDQIGVQAHAGRDIPISHTAPGAELSITEGAVRSLVREVGDELDGVIVERTALKGDIEKPDEPFVVEIDISLFAGTDEAKALEALKSATAEALARHAELHAEQVVVRIRSTDIPGGADDE
jgi:hypothetical protein